MRKTFIIFLIIFCFAVNCYALQDGLYSGSFEMCVENPVQCAPNSPGYVRIINLGNSNILYQTVVFWMKQEIILEEKECRLCGNAILCPPVDQVLDMSIYGFDAIVLNRSSHGAGIVTDNGFIMNYSVSLNTCEGLDCDIVGNWMFGEGSFPCKIGPWISEFVYIL